MTTFKTPKGTELPLMNLKGKNYLQVAFRIQWFVEERPDWSITARIVERTDSVVIMEASILDEKRQIRAVAHKVGKFAPLELEKVETGAIGRALAFLGFGTQFAEDLDESEDIADAPIKPKSNTHNLQPPKPASAKPPVIKEPVHNYAPGKKLSEAQVKRLWAISMANGFSKEQVYKLYQTARFLIQPTYLRKTTKRSVILCKKAPLLQNKKKKKRSHYFEAT